MNSFIWQAWATLNLPAQPDNPTHYFLSDFNSPDWHWIFRGVVILGFVVAAGVYAMYRGRDCK